MLLWEKDKSATHLAPLPGLGMVIDGVLFLLFLTHYLQTALIFMQHMIIEQYSPVASVWGNLFGT